MNNYEMMGSGESNWKTLELLQMGEKNSHNQKQFWEDGIKLELRVFGRMGMIWRRNSSSVFKIWEWRRETPSWIVEALRNEEWKGWANNERIWQILENGIWLMIIHSYVKLWNELRITLGKLEELGKILGKDLWVRAHSKDTPLKWFWREIAPG